MCGIAGGWASELVGGDALETALDALRHRGPDDGGVFRDGPVCLGMRRLAIIDLAGGRQPLANEDGTVTLVFNGEIYNYRELAVGLRGRGHVLRTDSDTEVLAHLYEDEGTNLLAPSAACSPSPSGTPAAGTSSGAGPLRQKTALLRAHALGRAAVRLGA